ncbi:MAG: hypothetical protein IJ033_03880 [Clostridia bacterium]|nr:hypothetical protein [Clostridia bacterium]
MSRITAEQRREIARERALRMQMNNKLENYLVEEDTQPVQPQQQEASFWQRSGETVADFLGSIAKGLGKGVEGIIDAGAGIVGGIGGLFDKDFQDNTRKFIETDYTQELYGKHIDEGTKNSYLNDNKVGEIIEGVGQGVGQMLPAVLVTMATGGGGAASLATMGVSAAGTATEEAFKDGADYYKGLGYGAVSGVVEAATEKLTGGLTSNLFGKGLLDGASKSVAKEVGEQGIKRVLKGAAEEGFEEMVSEAVQPVTKAIYKGKDAFTDYNFGEHLKDIAEAGIIGAGTSLAYGGTVSPVLSKLGKGAVGSEADIVSSLESNAEIDNKLAKLEYDNRLTEADERVALKNTRTNYENISNKLQKMGEKRRAKVIEKYGLGQYFNTDGSISENLSQSLEGRRLSVETNTEQNSPLASLSRASYSTHLRGQESKIQESLSKASNQTGTSVTLYQGGFEGQSNKNFSSFKKALNAFSTKSGERLSFVVVNPNEKVNAFIDDNVVYIGADKISNNQWMTDVVHEGMHFNESSTEYKTLIDYLSKSDVRVAQANAQLLNRGYNTSDVNVYGSEMNAILAENVLGNEHFINKVVYEELSLGEKILAKIQNFKYMLETIKQQGSRAYRELVQAEKLYLKAIENYHKGVTHTWNREESNENVTPSNQGVETNGEVRYNKKSYYSQFNTLALSWASRAQAGELKGFYDTRTYKIVEATGDDDVYVVIKTIPSSNEALIEYYEEHINDNNQSINRNAEDICRIIDKFANIQGQHDSNSSNATRGQANEGVRSLGEWELASNGERASTQSSGDKREVKTSLKDSQGRTLTKAQAKYIPYSKIGEENVRFVQRELYKLYQGHDNCVADGIAIENGNIVYIVDSGKENGEINFAFRKKLSFSNEELRKEYIRRTNNDSVSKGYISDGLSSKFRLGYDNDRGSSRGSELREELSTNQEKSTNNQEGVLGEDGDRGVHPLKKKPQYSLKDSQGRTLTEAQAKYFADSKVRDEQGNLQAVYHATNANFNIVDFKKNAQGLFWFASNKDALLSGQVSTPGVKNRTSIKVMELYANIVNPASWDEYDRYGIQQLKEKGYDGAILDNGDGTFIGFVFNSSNQIKLTTNENPTNNRDIRYSLNDSQGRALTQEQQAFYRNSKAVDKDGNLQVVYHGTEGEFFTFDKALRGSITGTKDAKLGFFFTSSKEVAREYAITAQEMKYYNYVYNVAQGDKDIINLLMLKDGYKQLPQTEMVKKVGELVEKAESGETDIKELYLNLENPLEKDWKGKAYKKVAMFKVVTEAIQGNYDGVIIRNIEDSVDQSGIYSDVFVAFEPNQIKLTTNKKPTNNEDIRYSYRPTNSLIDNYTEKQYNDFGWARVNEVLTANENSDFKKKYREIKAGRQKEIHKTSRGEIMVAVNDMAGDHFGVNNVIVFAKGSYDNYKILRVIRINLESETDIEIVREEIYRNENKPWTRQSNFYENLFGEELVGEYLPNSFGTYKELKAQRWERIWGQESQGVDGTNQILQDGRGNTRKVKFSLKSNAGLSEGEFRKIIANLKFEKKYSLNDAKDIVRHLVKQIAHDNYYAEFKANELDELSHFLWKGLNSQPEGYRSVSEKVADFLIEHATVRDIYTDSLDMLKDDAQRTIDVIKPYLHSLDLRSLKEEIAHNGSEHLYLRWSAGKDNKGIRVDELPALFENAGIYIDEYNPADILLRVDELYNEANQTISQREPTYKLSELLDADGLKKLKQSLMRETLFGFEFYGEETDFVKLKKKQEATVSKLKENLKEAIYASKIKGRISYIAKKITDKKLETFHNATQASDDTFKKSVGILSRLDYRGTFNESARNAIQSLSKWYVKENPLLTNAQDSEASIFDQTIADAINFVVSGNGKLTLDELKALEIIVRYFNGFLDTYNKTILNGRWVDVYKSAEQYYQVAERNGALRTGKPNRLTNIGRKYSESFSDPAHNARAADMYDENGFNTAMFNEFRQGEKNAAIEEMHILAELEEFYKKNKKWSKEAANRKITYLGKELPLLEALSLYMSLNREQAIDGLIENGFVYKVDEKGHEHRYKVNGVTEVSEGKVAQAQELRDSIKKQLNIQDVQFLDIAWKIFNEKCKKLKYDTDMRLYFYSNVVEGDYFPIKRDGIAYSVEQNFMEEMSLSSLSFNKDTIKGAKGRLFIEPITEVINRHVKGVCQYAHLKTAIDSYNKIYSMDIGGNKNKPKNLRSILPNQRNGMDEYFKKLITDIKGIKIVGETAFNKAIGGIRGGFVKFQLGLNLKVLVTQLSSFGASVSIINPVNIIKGFNVKTSDLDKYCPLAELRNNENTIVRAQGVIDKIGDFGSLLMKPIGMVDRFVVQRLYAACQYEIASKKNGAKVGTEENKIEAGKLLETVIFETQQNSMATERSQAMRSHSEIMKALTMFSSDAMKVVGRVLDGFGEISALKARIRIAEGSEKASFESKLKVAQKKTIRSIAALVSTSVFMACVAQAFKSLYKKDEDEKVLESMAFDAIGNMLGGLPIIKDIYAYLMDGYDINNYAYNSLNSLLESASDIIDTASNVISGKATTQQIASGTRSMVYAVGQLLGLPVRNLYNTVYGLINRFDSATAYKIDNVFYNKSYSSDLNKALEEGNERLVATISGIMLNENIGDIADEASRNELNRLVLGGYNVIPSAIKDNVSINGEETALTNKQKKEFNKVYSIAHEALASLIKQPLYDNASDETKAKAIKFIYDTYYDVALQDALGVDVDNKNVLFAEAIDIEKLALIIATARSLTADRDKKGNSITGSKKAKVQQYINSLRLTAAQKYMIMGYLGYTNKNGDTKVKAYINKLALSKSEKEELYKYSGYAA